MIKKACPICGGKLKKVKDKFRPYWCDVCKLGTGEPFLYYEPPKEIERLLKELNKKITKLIQAVKK